MCGKTQCAALDRCKRVLKSVCDQHAAARQMMWIAQVWLVDFPVSGWIIKLAIANGRRVFAAAERQV